MKARLADERGVTLVELMIAMFLLTLLLGGLADIVVSGLRASSDTSARTGAQVNIQTAVNRLEYELRCASGATVPNAGAANSSVTLTLPTQCVHATGQYTWCVSSGSLVRYSGANCSTGTPATFANNVTTPTPFTLLSATGQLPQLEINLTVNLTGGRSNSASITDTITLRNAPRA
jgi:prepilin-type N-terminal cleavage/methylation domain-containing protein